MTSVNWPPQEKRKLIGTRIDRLDGPAKSSGAAKYALDIQRPDMLYGKILGSPIAAGKLVSLDTKAAEALKGVAVVHVLKQPGAAINYAGEEILALAATTEEIAIEALKLVKAEYEVSKANLDDAIRAKSPAHPMPARMAIRPKPFPTRRRRSKDITTLLASRIVAWNRTAR